MHVCNANYATIMISPESDWSISKCFERFIGGNLITEAFPWSNIVQIKSCVNSRFCTSNWTVFFFFCGNFLDLMKNKLDVGRISRYSFAIFMERGIETKRSKRIKDNENFLVFHRFPPWNTFHPYYHTQNFLNLCSIWECFFQTDENIKSRKGDRCY